MPRAPMSWNLLDFSLLLHSEWEVSATALFVSAVLFLRGCSSVPWFLAREGPTKIKGFLVLGGERPSRLKEKSVGLGKVTSSHLLVIKTVNAAEKKREKKAIVAVLR